MEKLSELRDQRIDSVNSLLLMSVGEYLQLAEKAIYNNEYQRRRIRSSKTVYSLLKKDLREGCVIPSLVLALKSDYQKDSLDSQGFSKLLHENKHKILILDGLQRTYTLIELRDELSTEQDEEVLRDFLDLPLRVEFYLGINSLGILYRMLTLNTGQSPMSLRQQVEMLYLDYIGSEPEGIKLIRELENKTVRAKEEYSFKDVVEGFNSYLDRNELPISRSDLLGNIEALERIKNENRKQDIFRDYLIALSNFVNKCLDFEGQSNDELQSDDLPPNPFGKNVIKILKRPQVYSGFGAGVGKLIDNQVLKGLQDPLLKDFELKDNDVKDFILELNSSMAFLKENSPKIGNAQRVFFQFFFRDFFNKESDSSYSLIKSTQSALRKYKINYL